MKSTKLQEKFEKNGYIIVSASETILEKIRLIIFNLIKKKVKLITGQFNEKNIEQLFNNFHKIVKLKNLNEVRFSIYNEINKNETFSNLYYELAKNYLSEIVGNELAMQKKINLSIQMPNDKDSLLDMHSDIYAGESPFQVVLWTPLVNAYDTKAMFFTKPAINKKINHKILNSDKYTVKQLYEKNKKHFQFLNIKYGDVLLFSPLILHGNTINKTAETRFSLNCRFKSLLSPYDVTVKSHRNIPNFYRPLNMKPMTKIGFNYLKKFTK